MLPLMSYNFLQSARLLGSAAGNFAARCVEGIEADRERCEALVEQSLAMCTALAPKIGYDAAAEIAKTAFKEGRTVRELARERKVLPDDELDRVLDPRRQTEPG